MQSRLGPAYTPLVLVADGEIAAIPFAALYDSIRKCYLIEDHLLRLASSLRDATLPRPALVKRETTPLLVADPAFDPRAHP